MNKEQSLKEHDYICSKPWLVKKPLARIEKITLFNKKFYYQYCWQCLNCKWEGQKIRIRVI